MKGLAAGAANVAMALAEGAVMPGTAPLAGAGLLGLFGYGASLVLFIVALRHLGAARTGAYFSVAPFFGAALAMLAFPELPTASFRTAATLMAAGVWLQVTERHEHWHAHEVQEHSHPHVHDEHHQHAHAFEWDGREPQLHPHRHETIAHSHAHDPDLRHRHTH
jgi:hypothetical protein